jgi:hypothetical protein
MAGSLDLFDSVQLTASSEYASRQGEKIDTLQIHHATMTSLSGLIGLMQPGGRTVSANGAMGNDGHLVEVVPLANRPFTSATSYDRRSLTVEVCNTTLSPNWGISDACHVRLARLAVGMYRKGLLGSLSRKHIIGHREVPGTYATACPGPSMDLDRIVALAVQMNAAPALDGVTPIELPQGSENTMLMINKKGTSTANSTRYAIFGPNFWLEFTGDEAASKLIRQMTPVGNSLLVTDSFWDHCKAAAQAGTNV